MKAYYYMDAQGQQQGPVQENQLRANITPDTYVWCEGMDGWRKAKDVPDLGHIFAQTPPPGFNGGYNPGYGHGYAPGSMDNAGYQGHSQQFIPPKPSSNMVWAILTTILCCLPFGIVSIVYASKVDSLYFAGRYDEAYSASKKSRNWAIASAVSAVVISIIYFVFIGFAAFQGLAI